MFFEGVFSAFVDVGGGDGEVRFYVLIGVSACGEVGNEEGEKN